MGIDFDLFESDIFEDDEEESRLVASWNWEPRKKFHRPSSLYILQVGGPDNFRPFDSH